MNIIGEYTLKYDIYTMFNVYNVEIKNHNLITKSGYEFFLKKWYKDTIYPMLFGYYHENKFYESKNADGTYNYDMKDYTGSYSTTTNYVDLDTYKQYKFDGENFVDFYEKLDKICIGDCSYIDEFNPLPSNLDKELYNPVDEHEITGDGFVWDNTKLILKCEVSKEDLDGTTEIGVKTNHGRLVSHDIHAPYNLPFGTNLILEYVFKLNKEE